MTENNTGPKIRLIDSNSKNHAIAAIITASMGAKRDQPLTMTSCPCHAKYMNMPKIKINMPASTQKSLDAQGSFIPRFIGYIRKEDERRSPKTM